LVKLYADLKEKRSLKEISNDHFGAFIKFQRGITAYNYVNDTPRNWESEVYVYWGATGTGKTRKVHEENPNVWVHTDGPWFDGYQGEEAVLFDDFHGGVFKLPYLLKLLDRYPMRVPIKGGFVQWKPKRIYITSNLDPDTWFYNAHEEHKNALKRRFKEVLKFD